MDLDDTPFGGRRKCWLILLGGVTYGIINMSE
jgi:hypothetical protein